MPCSCAASQARSLSMLSPVEAMLGLGCVCDFVCGFGTHAVHRLQPPSVAHGHIPRSHPLAGASLSMLSPLEAMWRRIWPDARVVVSTQSGAAALALLLALTLSPHPHPHPNANPNPKPNHNHIPHFNRNLLQASTTRTPQRRCARSSTRSTRGLRGVLTEQSNPNR